MSGTSKVLEPSGGLALGQDLGQGHTKADVELMQERQMVFRATHDSAFLSADHFYTAQLTTLNRSGVTGEAVLGLDDQTHTLTVAIMAKGLEPGMPHPQHIHGFLDGTDAVTPTAAQDTDHDGFVELAEGLVSYGPILLNLTTDGTNGTGGDNGHATTGPLAGFPTAPDGTEWFVESYQLPDQSLSADPMLNLREIVLHGMTVSAADGAGTSGEVDGTAGYKAVLPVASGEIEAVSSSQDLRSSMHSTGFDAAGHAALHDGWMMT